MKNSCKHQKLIEKRIPFYNDFTGDESIDVIWEWEDTFKDIDLQRQLRRATVSISSNIAEGFERNTDKEFIHFLFIAKGSAGEVRSQ